MRPQAETPKGRWDEVTQRTWRGDYQGGTPLIEIRSGGMYAARTTFRVKRKVTLQRSRQAKLPGGSRKGDESPLRSPGRGERGGNMRKARQREDEQAIAAFERTRKSRSVPMEHKRTTHYGNIIRQYRERAGLDQKTVAEALSYSTNTISNWENGISRPDIDAVAQLCGLLRIPLPVFFGVTDDPAAPETEKRLTAAFRTLGEDRRQLAVELLESLARDEERLRQLIKSLAGRRRLPVQALSAAAGTGTPLDDIGRPRYVYAEDNRLSRMADELYLVNGDSMEPTYHDGDLVYVQHAQTLEKGEIGIFVVAGAGYIKEYRKTGLYSHNKAYKPIRPSDDDSVRLIGRVLGRAAPEEILEPEL